jgi:hypothetical protein
VLIEMVYGNQEILQVKFDLHLIKN